MTKKRKRGGLLSFALFMALCLPILYSLTTKNPEGSNVSGSFYPAENVEFLLDLSYEQDGQRRHEQEIFNAQLELIKEAEDFLLLDLFLYNDDYNRGEISYRPQVSEMTEALIAKKREKPEMPIVFITDPINNFYGVYEEDHLTSLREEGVEVVVSDLNRMRDSNPLISGPYRAYGQWFGTRGPGLIPNLFEKEGPKVTLRSLLKLANFKGNHRKVILSEKQGIVASANPHDPSSLHSNVAISFQGQAMRDLLDSELMLVENPPEGMLSWEAPKAKEEEAQCRVLTEKAIFNALEENIARAEEGDEIWLAIFYLSDFDTLIRLGQASDRGARVRIIADLNKDAFGLEKNGSPNRPSLSELKEKHPEVEIRWAKTNGEQFHTKMAYFNYQQKDPRVILGSANFTRRNLKDYNLETNLELLLKNESPLQQEVDHYYHRIWENQDGLYSVDFEEGKEEGLFLRTLWKIQERTGLCTW